MTSKYNKAYYYYHNINDGNGKFGWRERRGRFCDILWCIEELYIIYFKP